MRESSEKFFIQGLLKLKRTIEPQNFFGTCCMSVKIVNFAYGSKSTINQWQKSQYKIPK